MFLFISQGIEVRLSPSFATPVKDQSIRHTYTAAAEFEK